MFGGNKSRGRALFFVAILSLSLEVLAAGTLLRPPDIASQYSLATSTSLPFPSSTQSNTDTQAEILQGWSVNRERIQQGAENIEFVSDPFPNYRLPGSTSFPSPSGSVLRVTYPKGGFGSAGSGAQFYSMWNSTGAPFKTMLLTYEVAFDSTFDWVQGGKLPGLRGGPDPNACGGGSQPDGTCFSTRIMWRKSGDGEGAYVAPVVSVPVPQLSAPFILPLAYAYILTPNNLCGDQNVLCNDDYGTSLGRGQFRFQAGQ